VARRVGQLFAANDHALAVLHDAQSFGTNCRELLWEASKVNELLQQLREARLRASANEMSKAKGHIEEALELLDDALTQRPGPKPSARAIRGYLAEARVAATKADSRSTVSALDEAILALEQGPRTG
jgi:hypothetical protein